MTVLADLHTHSTASDGQYAPAALVEKAAAAGIQVLAVTDHDTIDGAEEAVRAGTALGLTVLRGVELGAAEDRHMHILGLHLGPECPALTALCRKLRASRDERKFRIVDFLREKGMDVSLEEVEALAGGGVVARPHFAQVMLRRGYVTSLREAFDRYLDSDEYQRIERWKAGAAECIAAVHSAGGRAVLAHPYIWAMRMIDWRRPSVPCGRRGSTVWSASIPVIPRDRLPPICVLRKNMGSISQQAAISTGKPSVRTPD